MLTRHHLRRGAVLALGAPVLAGAAHAQQTQVVLLGTGNPPADPDRSGPATAIVVNALLISSTSARAAREVRGRRSRDCCARSGQAACRIRDASQGAQYVPRRCIRRRHAVHAHEIKPGVVYKDANVTVTAFATKHAMESYDYRFDTPDRSIVLTHDWLAKQARPGSGRVLSGKVAEREGFEPS
jgi:hypothetical protein